MSVPLSAGGMSYVKDHLLWLVDRAWSSGRLDTGTCSRILSSSGMLVAGRCATLKYRAQPGSKEEMLLFQSYVPRITYTFQVSVPWSACRSMRCGFTPDPEHLPSVQGWGKCCGNWSQSMHVSHHTRQGWSVWILTPRFLVYIATCI